LYGGLDVLFTRLLMQSDDLRGARGIQRLDLVGSLNALPADDEIVFAAELSAHTLDSRAHFAGIVFLAKIIKRLIDERARMRLG
jgi:hypothetical protein